MNEQETRLAQVTAERDDARARESKLKETLVLWLSLDKERDTKYWEVCASKDELEEQLKITDKELDKCKTEYFRTNEQFLLLLKSFSDTIATYENNISCEGPYVGAVNAIAFELTRISQDNLDAKKYRWLMGDSVFHGTLATCDGWLDFEFKEDRDGAITRAMKKDMAKQLIGGDL